MQAAVFALSHRLLPHQTQQENPPDRNAAFFSVILYAAPSDLFVYPSVFSDAFLQEQAYRLPPRVKMIVPLYPPRGGFSGISEK
nr:hypothetical protein [Enterocloster clostridioformis]